MKERISMGKIEIIKDFMLLIISVAALYVSFVSTKIQLEHNRLSELPICMIYTANFDDSISVDLINKGLGPMIIQDYKFTLNGKEKEQLYKFLSNYKGSSYNCLGKNLVVASNESIYLVKYDVFTTEQRERFIKELSDVKIEINYKDVYNKSYYFEQIITFSE